MANIYYTIGIDGVNAVNAALKINAGMCYSTICNGIAQLEAVLDDYITCSYIENESDITFVLNALKEMGFNGCKCSVSRDVEDGCYVTCETLYETVI